MKFEIPTCGRQANIETRSNFSSYYDGLVNVYQSLTPAKAGVQSRSLDSRFHGNDNIGPGTAYRVIS